MHKDNAEKILLDAGGLTYVHAKLNQSKKSPPTAENLRLVEAIMQRAGPSHKVVLAALYEDAIAWRDLSLWKRIITIYSQPSSSNSWKREYGKLLQHSASKSYVQGRFKPTLSFDEVC